MQLAMKQHKITIYQLSLPRLYARLKELELTSFLSEDPFVNYKLMNAVFSKAMLSAYTKTEAETKDLQVNRFGKPILNPEKFENLHFNKSNTKDYLIMAIAALPLGIDLEIVRPSFKVRILDHVAHPNDAFKVENAAQFYALWSMKEAFVKYTGRGLQIPLHEVLISSGNAACFEASYMDMGAEIRSVKLLDEHCCYLAYPEASKAQLEVVNSDTCEQILTAALQRLYSA
jgi:phosphopantetheinyl transferase